jgi:hypothetical protein
MVENLGAVSALTGSLNGLNVTAIDSTVEKIAKSPVAAEQSANLSSLEKQLISNYVGLPLFELPSRIFTSKRASGFKPNLNQQFTTWGYPYWSVSTSSK